jgi:hypothetical protein
MKLENFNMEELSIDERKSIEGGNDVWDWMTSTAGDIVGMVVDGYNDMVEAFKSVEKM